MPDLDDFVSLWQTICTRRGAPRGAWPGEVRAVGEGGKARFSNRMGLRPLS